MFGISFSKEWGFDGITTENERFFQEAEPVERSSVIQAKE
jgi:hypothetical protein